MTNPILPQVDEVETPADELERQVEEWRGRYDRLMCHTRLLEQQYAAALDTLLTLDGMIRTANRRRANAEVESCYVWLATPDARHICQLVKELSNAK